MDVVCLQGSTEESFPAKQAAKQFGKGVLVRRGTCTQMTDNIRLGQYGQLINPRGGRNIQPRGSPLRTREVEF